MDRSEIVLMSLMEALSSFYWVVPLALVLGFLVAYLRRDLKKRNK